MQNMIYVVRNTMLQTVWSYSFGLEEQFEASGVLRMEYSIHYGAVM